MGILQKIIFVIVFVVSTLSFLVIFNHGVKDFGANLGVEIESIVETIQKPLKKREDTSDKVVPQ